MIVGDKEQTLSLLKEFLVKINVLVVDSDLITLIEIEKTMRQFEYQVITYPEADKAIEYLTKSAHEINLAVWDFHMPKINGLEALQIIGSNMDLPVVIMSDDNRTESVMKATIHGAFDYVLKPVDEKDIANIWKHIILKKMMSKPVVTESVQSDLVPSHGFVQVNNDPMTIDQGRGEKNIYMDDQVAMWCDLDLSFKSDIDETKSLYLDDDDLKIIYQDEGEQNIDKDGQNAAEKLRKMSPDSTQSDQSNLVIIDGSDVDNDEQKNMDKKVEKSSNSRMTWTGELHNKFLKAIEILGGTKKATSLKIFELMQEMNTKGLTKDHVSSHLQKHREKLKEKRVPQQTLDNAYRPPSLIGSSDAHTDISQFPGYGVYGPSSLIGPSNSYSAIPSVMSGGDMNQIHQNQYPSTGYLTANSNQFMTSPVPSWPYSDNHGHHHDIQLQQQQQQQYQSPHQMEYGMNNKEPEQAYGDDDIELIYPELPYDPNEYLLKGNPFYPN